MVVHHTVRGDPVVMEIFRHIVVMEIILTWLWLIGIVAYLVKPVGKEQLTNAVAKALAQREIHRL